MMDYYTVSEYAKVSGKDPGNIRRMLINGTLSGEKMGNQWIIPKNSIPPKDRRVKSGNYRNWRQKIQFQKLHPEKSKLLYLMCSDLEEIYADSLDEIMLYGSYARGQETDESDLDIALVLKTEQTEDQHNRAIDVIVDYELEMGVTLSVIPIEYKNYSNWCTVLPYYKNLYKEGIILWKNK